MTAETTTPWRQVQAEYACEHELTEVRRKRDSMDRPHAVKQCIRCGAYRGGVSRAGMSQATYDVLPAYDEDRAAIYDREMRAEVQRREEAGRGDRQAEYAAYLLTPHWQELRARVLDRDDYICRCCLRREATEVHHLTYANRGAERAWQLVGVCSACHQRITAEDAGEGGL